MASSASGESPHPCYAEAAAAGSGSKLRSKRPPSRCVKCEKTVEYLQELDCQIHYICKGCLRKKTKQDGADDMYACSAEGCVKADQSQPPIHIFVDNSNIWIEAKKHGSEKKKFGSSKDHRVHINYGPLTDVVANGRKAVGTPYGSRPLDIDPVWNKIRERGWKVNSTINKDILLLLKVPPSQRSTIVLISGDRDMRPTVEGILEEAVGWKIEICMWERNISQGLKELDGKYEHLSILPLDEHWDEVVYTENVAPPNTDPNSSIVLTVTRGKFSKGDRIDLTQPLWWDTLEQLCHMASAIQVDRRPEQ